MQNGNNLWIQRSSPKPEAKIKLICLHYAGGAANFFSKWHESLPDDVEVQAVQLPGRWERHGEPPLTDMQTVVDVLMTEAKAQVNGPFVLLGYSLGARIAFEWARALRKAGARSPAALFVLASKSPTSGKTFERPVHVLADLEFLQIISQAYGNIPRVLLEDPEMRELFMMPLRADMKIFENYQYTADDPFSFPIYAAAGESDQMLKTEAVKDWQRQTSAAFETLFWNGGHFPDQKEQARLLEFISRKIGALK